MANYRSRASRADSEDDLHLLLECLQFQQNCVSSQCQALTTLAAMCSNSSTIRDRFRSSGGMKYVLELLYSTSSSQIQQAALYTLGCAAEMNVVNQLKLCDTKLFTFLADLLKTSSNTSQANDGTTSSPNPAIIATTAYLAGCLMCSNIQGQNLAREKRVLHKLAGQFKSHLPTLSTLPALQESSSTQSVRQQQQESGSQYSLEVWTSVCSALCSATNNPQNEVNQGLCSQLLPAALSVLNHVPLKTDTLRPAVTLIASCLSNNASTQSRLRLIGGLQVLVTTLKQLILPPVEVPTRNHMYSAPELSVHIVRTLSSAMLGNVENTHLVSTLDVIPVLLHLLQSSKRSEDESVTITIVMCLGMLTEERPTAQQQLVSHGGVQLLLSAMAESGNGELNKAITFVLQQCLQQADCTTAAVKMEGQHDLCDEIARVEGLLAEEDQDLSPIRLLTESHQIKLDPSSPNPASADLHKQASATTALQILDSQKQPVIERVSTWLANNEACHGKQDDEKNVLEELLQQYMTKASRVPLLKNKGKVMNPPHVENAELLVQPSQYKVVSKKNLAENVLEESRQHCPQTEKDTKCGVAKQTNAKRDTEQPAEVDSIQTMKVVNKPSQSHTQDKPAQDEVAQLPSGKTHCENLEAELTRERARRMKLEKELHKLEQAKQKKRQKENSNRKKDKQAPNQDVSGNHSSKQADGQSQIRSHTTQMANVASSLKESSTFLPTQVESTPMPMKSNIRYAASANVHQSHSLRTMVLKSQLERGCKYQSKTPGPNHSLSTLRRKNGKDIDTGVHKSNTDGHISNHFPTKKRDNNHWNKEKQAEPTCSSRQPNTCKHSSMDVTTSAPGATSHQSLHLGAHKTHLVIRDQTSSVGFQQPLSHVHVARSTLHESQYLCDHQCLGCKPRVKCPLITSRNFTTLLRSDHFTCPYHRRLVHRLIGHMKTREPSISCDCRVTTGEGNVSRYGDEDHHIQNDMGNARNSQLPSHNTLSIGHHQQASCTSIADVKDFLQPNNDEATLVEELLLPLAPLNDGSSTLTMSKSTVSCSNTTASTSSPEVGHSREHDPDWSPAAPSESNTTDSSCEIVSVQQHGMHEETGGDRVNKVHCKTESVSTDDMPPCSLDEEYMSHLKTERNQDTQYRQKQRHKANSKFHQDDDSTTTTTTHGVSHEAALSTVTDCPPETVYQLIAQPQKRKTVPVKLSSLPQRNALKNVSNQQRFGNAATERRHSLSVFDYETPQKIQHKYNLAKSKQTQHTTVADGENKPTFKQQRVIWSKSEEENLIRGVNKLGRRWRHILNAYTFHPCRTPVHLKDKYRNIMGRQ